MTLDKVRNLKIYLEHSLEISSDAVLLEEDKRAIIEALDKQIPKNPAKVANSGIRYTNEYTCPTCGKHFTGTGIADYCYHCGQALNWRIFNEYNE